MDSASAVSTSSFSASIQFTEIMALCASSLSASLAIIRLHGLGRLEARLQGDLGGNVQPLEVLQVIIQDPQAVLQGSSP